MEVIGVGLIAVAVVYWIVGPPTVGISKQRYIEDLETQLAINADQLVINANQVELGKIQLRVNESQVELNDRRS